MQQEWIERHRLGWDAARAQRSAQRMYDDIFSMRFLPPGRGLWAMGTPVTRDRRLFAALNNCAFVSTRPGLVGESASTPYSFLMDMSMLGVGVGFDTAGAGKVLVRGMDASAPPRVVRIADSREGWVHSLAALIDAHIEGTARPHFDYSLVRAKGLPIKGFGGLASGPAPLAELHTSVDAALSRVAGSHLDERTIVDIMNMIGRCVVSGNVRRTAEIAFGSPDSETYIDLKNYERFPERASYGWTSNNSVFATLGMKYDDICRRVEANGEPGFFWLENAQRYGRMGDPPNNKDMRAMGGNPCLEQTLEPFELCCLVETFPFRHENIKQYKATLKSAYLYAKTVTLGQTHWTQSNRVMLRNRRVGASMSGIAQFVAKNGMETLREWCDEGYKQIEKTDESVSEWLAIPKSIKTTSIKPSGTVSLLAGGTNIKYLCAFGVLSFFILFWFC